MSLEARQCDAVVPPGNDVIIFNPEAGTRSLENKRVFVRRAVERLKAYSRNVLVWETTQPGEEAVLAQRAVKDKKDIIWAAGGDGTAQGMLAVLAESQTTALGVLPLGTINLWAKETGISKKPETAVDMQLADQIRHMDVGSLNGVAFRSSGGVGFDGYIAHKIDSLRVENGKRVLRGSAAYFAACVRNYLATPETQAAITVDGRTETTSLFQAWISNTRLHAYMELGQEGLVTDGRLEVAVFPKLSIPIFAYDAIPALVRHMLSQPGKQAPHATYFKSQSGTITTEDLQYAQVDGQPQSPKPSKEFAFDTLPEQLPVLAPNTPRVQRLFGTY
jgi:diacylglycerol kinase family enzyme